MRFVALCLFAMGLISPVVGQAGVQTFEWRHDGVTLEVETVPVNEVLEIIEQNTGIPISIDPGETRILDGLFKKRRLEDLILSLVPGAAITYVYNERMGDYMIESIVCSRTVTRDEKAEQLRELTIKQKGLDEKMQVRVPASEKYTGIGAAISPVEDGAGVWVRPLHDNAPAARAGLKLGDMVVAIDGVPVNTFTNIAAISKAIRGPQNTTVTLTVRQPDGSEKTLPIQREMFQMAPQTP